MVYRDNCELCGESFTDENLLSCKICGRDFCYRCGDWGPAQCNGCRDPSPSTTPDGRGDPEER